MADDEQIITESASDSINMPEDLFMSLLQAGQEARQRAQHQVTTDWLGRKKLTHSSQLDKHGKKITQRRAPSCASSESSGSPVEAQPECGLLTLLRGLGIKIQRGENTFAQQDMPGIGCRTPESQPAASGPGSCAAACGKLPGISCRIPKSHPTPNGPGSCLDIARCSSSRSLKQNCCKCYSPNGRKDSLGSKSSSSEVSSARLMLWA